MQHKLKTVTQPGMAFCVLEIRSTKSVTNVQQEFRRKFDKRPSALNYVKKCDVRFVKTDCMCEGKISGQPSRSA